MAGRPVGMGFPDKIVAIYAGSGRSSTLREGEFVGVDREEIKLAVRRGTLRLVFGTKAVSNGLNLKGLGALIHLDLP